MIHLQRLMSMRRIIDACNSNNAENSLQIQSSENIKNALYRLCNYIPVSLGTNEEANLQLDPLWFQLLWVSGCVGLAKIPTQMETTIILTTRNTSVRENGIVLVGSRQNVG